VLRPDSSASEAELIEFCRPHLAAYKLPRSVRFVPDLPKTSTGKIMRRQLRSLDQAASVFEDLRAPAGAQQRRERG
jgi:long-chain acyl-CoA synthetase